MRRAAFFLVLLIGSTAPAVTLALADLPAIPNLGQSGQDVTLPEVVGDHHPPALPAGPPDSSVSFSNSEIPGPPFETPVGPPEGVPPDPVTPAHGEHPLGGAPPFGLGPSVPEPAVHHLLLAAGFAGLLLARRQRRA